jgi:hypothetical protein
MFISSPLDKFSSHWTKHGPSANILTRLVLLATKSLEIIRQQISFNDNPDLKVGIDFTLIQHFTVNHIIFASSLFCENPHSRIISLNWLKKVLL